MILYKYLPPERIDVLRDGLIRLTQAAALNDPFDCKVRYLNPDEVSHDLKGERCCLLSYVQGLQYSLLRDERVSTLYLCLTEKTDSLLMWSHYAKNHEGFLIGFDVTHEFFSKDEDATGLWKVTYTNKRPAFPKEVLEEELSRQPGINPYGSLNAFFLGEHRFNPDTTKSDYRFIKSKEWEYEHEWRLIRRIKPPYIITHDGPPFPVYLFPFPHAAVRSVIIGCRGVSKLHRQIEEIIKTNEGYAHVKILHASTKHDYFGLHIQKYDSNKSPLYLDDCSLIPEDEEDMRINKKTEDVKSEHTSFELESEISPSINFICSELDKIQSEEKRLLSEKVTVDINEFKTSVECFNLFVELAENNRSDDAIAVLWRAIDLNQDRTEGFLDASGFLTRIGLIKQAISLLQIALTEKPKLAYPHYCLGSVYLIQQEIWRAEAAFRTAIKLDPTLAEAWTNLGSIYQHQGRGHDAVACYQKASEIKPTLMEPIWNLAHILVKNNMNEDFFKIFTDTLTKNEWSTQQLAAFGAGIVICISDNNEHCKTIIEFFKRVGNESLLNAMTDILQKEGKSQGKSFPTPSTTNLDN